MANLMLTTGCNFTCDYCFAKEMIGPGHPHETMGWNLFLDLLDWIDRANAPDLDIHLMGGEPTLNPLFSDMAYELVRRRRKVVVFSNAAASIDTKILTDSARLGIHWIVNVNPPQTYRQEALRTLREHLALLGPAASITLNMTSPSAPFDHVLSYMDEFGLKRRIKIGVALPTLKHTNTYARREDLPGIADRIMRLRDAAQDRGIALEFECGVPYCLFTADQHRKLPGVRVSHCGSRLDITPTGNLINCLPLCRIASIPYTRFSTYRRAQEWFGKALTPYGSFGSTSACPTCAHLKQGRCRVCLAHALCDLDQVVLPPLPSQEEPGAGGSCRTATREKRS
jgi:hypothetical protein